MKQFGKILSFELKYFFKNKVFVGVTLLIVAVLTVVMFFPRISDAIGTEEADRLAKAAFEDSRISLLARQAADEERIIRA